MNRNRIRITAALLAAIIAVVGVQVAVAASADRAADDNLNVSALSAVLNGETDTEKASLEDEAAYIFTDATGTVTKVIVSDWLKDGSGDAYTRNEEDYKVPVDMKISYTLDGREVQPAELAGKSGQVTMKFDYINNEKRTTDIEGKKEDIYVPFLMLSGMILDNEHFSNIKVENGKLINDGSRQIVIGYALPGLQESLALKDDQLKIPDSFTVSADVKDFELDMVLTFASTGLLNELDTDNIDSLDDLKESLAKMTDAMDQLTDGAAQLQSGLETLLSESGKLESGVNELADGAKAASAGASQLADGAGSLTDGASQLYAGLSELTSNSSALNDGAAKVFAALLNTAQTQIRAAGQDISDLTISNYSDEIDSLIRSLDDEGIYSQALAKVSAGVDAAGDEVYKTYLENNAESIYRTYLESIADSLYEQYLESIADDVYSQYIEGNTDQICMKYLSGNADAIYRQYIEGNADQICMQYLSGNADAIYRQYIESNAESIFSSYVSSQIPEERKEAMTEEELAQTVAALVNQLTDDQKEQILTGAVAQLTGEQKEQILAGAAAQLTDEQKEQILAGALAQLTDDQKEQILAGTLAQLTDDQKEQILAGAAAQLTDDQKEQILAGALAQLTDDQKEQILAGALAQLTDDQKEQILAGALAQLTDEQKAQIRQGAIDLVMASDEVQEQMNSAADSVQQLAGLKAQLDTYNQFYLGLRSYTAGVASAADGAGSLVAGCGQLQSGAASLSDGSKQIADGCEELRSNIPALLDGITQLKDGSAALSEGLNEFKQEAIQKLSDAVSGDLDGLLARIRAVRQAGEDYESAASDGNTLSGAKLIYRMDAISK